MNEEMIRMNNRELSFRKIRVEDKNKVLNLFRECKDYFELTQGTIPDDCDSFFYDLPPNKTIEDKYLYGVFDKNLLVGAIDIISNYPKQGEWIIGLLLLHPNTRGIGLGKEIHNLIIKLVKKEGAEALRVGVVEQNKDALYFWHKIGYKQTKITEARKFGIKESKVVLMNYYL